MIRVAILHYARTDTVSRWQTHDIRAGEQWHEDNTTVGGGTDRRQRPAVGRYQNTSGEIRRGRWSRRTVGNTIITIALHCQAVSTGSTRDCSDSPCSFKHTSEAEDFVSAAYQLAPLTGEHEDARLLPYGLLPRCQVPLQGERSESHGSLPALANDVLWHATSSELALAHTARKIGCRPTDQKVATHVPDVLGVLRREGYRGDVHDCRRAFALMHLLDGVDRVFDLSIRLRLVTLVDSPQCHHIWSPGLTLGTEIIVRPSCK